MFSERILVSLRREFGAAEVEEQAHRLQSEIRAGEISPHTSPEALLLFRLRSRENNGRFLLELLSDVANSRCTPAQAAERLRGKDCGRLRVPGSLIHELLIYDDWNSVPGGRKDRAGRPCQGGADRPIEGGPNARMARHQPA